jgi:hypothetical protein
MEVEFAFLADAAEAPADSKLYVLGGGINEVGAPSFPATHGALALVVKIKLHPTECGRPHQIEIEFWDPDGRLTGPSLSGELFAERDQRHPTRPQYVQLVVNMIGLPLPAPGDYDFHIIVNRQHLKTIPLYVEQIDELAQEPPDAKNGDDSNGVL